ncbi:MAG: C45 family peptidase [Candidatus Omnitrophica bacterium]|nr:C45 family peptidase [Candidatus Omnitrophota bacterium]
MRGAAVKSNAGRWLMAACAALVMNGCAGPQEAKPILKTIPPGELSWIHETIPVLFLSGSPYEMGYQHGSLMPRQVKASVDNVMAFIKREVGIPMMGTWLAYRKLDQTWAAMKPHVPASFLEEMRGLADASGIPLKTLERVHALPELMATTCAAFAAFGRATRDGRMVHIRNLDWAIQSDVQRYAAVFVHHPKNGKRFVSLGWLGFTGVISGINEEGIAVGEIGSETVDQDMKGTPMPFLLRRVLQESEELEEAVEIIRTAERTTGYNYLFSDAQTKRAVALETTKSHCAVFWIDQEPEAPYRISVENVIFRADTAFDPQVRDLQTASKGDPDKPGLESPEGSGAYETRYKGQGLLLRQFYGQVDPEIGMSIARAIAPKSNVQSVVYAFPKLWVANARGRDPAATQVYHEVDLAPLFQVSLEEGIDR